MLDMHSIFNDCFVVFGIFWCDRCKWVPVGVPGAIVMTVIKYLLGVNEDCALVVVLTFIIYGPSVLAYILGISNGVSIYLSPVAIIAVISKKLNWFFLSDNMNNDKILTFLVWTLIKSFVIPSGVVLSIGIVGIASGFDGFVYSKFVESIITSQLLFLGGLQLLWMYVGYKERICDPVARDNTRAGRLALRFHRFAARNAGVSSRDGDDIGE